MRQINHNHSQADEYDATMDGVGMPEVVLVPEDTTDCQTLAIILRAWLRDVQVYVSMKPVAGSWKLADHYDADGWAEAVRYDNGMARATVRVRVVVINGELAGEIDRGGHDGRSLMGHAPHQPSVYV